MRGTFDGPKAFDITSIFSVDVHQDRKKAKGKGDLIELHLEIE